MNLTNMLCFTQKPKLPMVFQDERAECGHACVAMVSNFHGHHLDLLHLRKIRETSNQGLSLLDMSQLLDHLGFMTRALQVPLEELHLVQCPAILHWNMNHFVVLKQVKKTHVVIHDPAIGVRHCKLNEVSRAFTGIVLEVNKSQDFKAIQQKSKLSLYDLVRNIRGVNRLMALLLLISLSIECLGLLSPLFLQYVMDSVIGYSEQTNLYVIAAGFLILTVLHGLTSYTRAGMVIYLTNHLTEQFSSNVLKHLLKLPLSFFEKRHKGDLQAKFQSIDHIQKKISTDFVNTVLDGLMILVNMTVMMIYSPLLTAWVLLAQGLGLGYRHLSYQQFKKQAAASVHQHAKAATSFLETLHAIVPIKSYLKEQVRFNGWRNAYIDSLNANIRVSKMNALYQLANQVLFNVEYMIVVCMGASLVLSHHFSAGMLMAFLSYRLLLVNKASSFVQQVMDYRLVSIQLHRLSDIVFQQPEIIQEGTGFSGEIQGALTLKNVSFAYSSQARVIFHQVNMSIQAGEKVAIIGPSGCGKSTLLKIMMGLLEPTAGTIEIDGVSLSDRGLKHYREMTASVMQDDMLLSGSILDNISFFAETTDRVWAYQVAQLACIHEDILQLPMGYETLVNDMGSNLSGGQRQRLLLARALYKRPKLLFLDEATSHLDVHNEKNINQALASLTMTQIVIAHRQETIQMADRIIDLTNSCDFKC